MKSSPQAVTQSVEGLRVQSLRTPRDLDPSHTGPDTGELDLLDLERARATAAEARVRELEERLQDAAARADQLTDQYAAAERRFLERDRMAAISALFASCAHDIRSPLMALVCNSKILEEMIGTSSLAGNATVCAIFEDDRTARDNIDSVLTSLRAYATGHAEACEMSVRNVVESTLRLYRWHMSQKGIRFAHRIEGDPTAFGLPSELCQVLLNLLSNAVDASRADDIVSLEVFQDGDEAVIRVFDRGPPVPPDDAELVFLPFLRRDRDGMGVGLSVARSMIRRYGGDIRLDASYREGACFEVRLPAARAASARR